MTNPSPGVRSKDDNKEQAPGGAGGGEGGPTQPLSDSGSDLVVGNNNNNNNNNKNDDNKDALSASSYSDDYTSSYDDSDDSDFSETSETSVGADDTAAAEAEMMREESKQLCFWRSIVLGSMFVATIILIIVVYNFTRRGEFNDFEQEFDDYAAKIMETVPQKLAHAIGQVDVLAISVMSYAKTNDDVNVNVNVVEWPYVAIPEFELKARNTRRLGELEFVSLVPIVPSEERETWESFAVTEKDWVEWGYFQQQQQGEEGEGEQPGNSLDGGGSGSSGDITTTTSPPAMIATTTPEPENNTTETAPPRMGTPETGAPETTDPPTAAPATAPTPVPDNAFVPFRNRVLLEKKATEEEDKTTAEAMQIKFASMEEALEDFWITYGTTTGTLVNYTTSSATTNNNNSSETGIATQIYRMDGIHKIVEDHPGPFFPMWQSSPVVPSVVNFNLASHATAGPEVLLALDSAQIVLGAVVNTTSQDDPFQVMDAMKNVTLEERIAAGPISFLYFPILQNLPLTTTTTTTTTGAEPQVVALLTSMIRWTDVLHGGDLPDTAHGILCVIENDCNQRFSFLVSQQQVIYLGHEYVHDPTFRHLHVTTSFQTLLEAYLEQQDDGAEGTLTSTPGITLNANYCPYRLSIYPTMELQEQFITNKPELIAVLVGAAFCITAFVFLCYDGHVETRQRLLVSKAVTSHQIVSSLFPEVVRDRLFGTESKGSKGGSVSNDPTRPVENMETDKLRLKNYINTGGATGADGVQSKPIADLFTHCTVMFGDIAGFTAWSSMREPVQVFTLLESLYAAFDKIATKRRVFKVETIGDCYMAVTGLPDPQADHAILMARFARDILRRTQQLTRKLEYRLGPDTTDLAMRIGLHSGPVTAGVLRGQKSRFQLFGDTVNTASRMESTGSPQQIQCSQTTADLIREAGKGAWLVPRLELVKAKGKGEVQTFWITPKTFRESLGDASYFDGEMTETFDAVTTMLDDVDMQLNARRPTVSLSSYRKRIIGWNVELLASLLRKLIAHRGGFIERSSDEEEKIEGFLSELAESSCPRDSYSEAIEMPKFDPNRVKSSLSPDDVVLSPSVEAQLKDYVTTISCSYQDNPFHNFEHASHVAMCANKLLTRITAAEDFDLHHHAPAGNVSAGLHNYTFGIMNDPLTHFACVFSAMIHDVDHPGVSNQQLIKEKDEMAAMYDGKSVAEQNSVDVAWDLLMDPIYSELRQCIWNNMDELKRFRKLIVNSVMATDIFDPELVKVRNERWAKAFAPDAGDEVVDLKATIVIEHIIQASDVAHTMQHWHVYQKWNEKLFSEMCLSYEAGRLEKDPGLGWYGGELWFYDNYIIPLAKKLKECGVFGVSSDEFLTYAMDNRTEWESKGKQIVADYISRLAQDLEYDSVSTDSSEELPLNDMEDFDGAGEEASVEEGAMP